MSVESWYKVLATAEVAGAALTNTVTATSLLPTQARHTIAPDAWWIGKRYKINIEGKFSNVITAQPTLTFDVRFGSTVVFTTGAILTSTTAHTDSSFTLTIPLTCRAVGSAANLIGQATLIGQPFLRTGAGAVADFSVANPGSGLPTILKPETAAVVGNNYDTNASQQVDIFGTWSAANAANSITILQYELLSGE